MVFNAKHNGGNRQAFGRLRAALYLGGVQLMRWGISAIVGGSFGEIFFGNCLMLGIPCLVASQEDLEWLQKAISRAPKDAVSVDVDKQEVRFGDRVIKATVPAGPRNQLVGGTWDSTAVLLEAGAAIEATAGRLPYVKGW